MVDKELTEERNQPFPSKVCQERIDDHVTRARAILADAEAESREPNEDEAKEFDEIVDDRIPAWKQELAAAREWERDIVARSLGRLQQATRYGNEHKRLY